MISYPTSIAEELKKTYNTIVFLLNINDEYFFTNNNEDIYLDANKYIALGLEITDFAAVVNLGKSSIEIKIDNVSLIPTSLVLNSEMRGKETILSIMAYKNDANISPFVAEMFRGYISDYAIENNEAKITVQQQLIYWDKNTFRQYTYKLFPNLKDLELKQIMWGRDS